MVIDQGDRAGSGRVGRVAEMQQLLRKRNRRGHVVEISRTLRGSLQVCKRSGAGAG